MRFSEAVASRNHDVQQKNGRRLLLGIGDDTADRHVRPDFKAGSLQVVLDQAGDIRVVFKQENRLTQVAPRRFADLRAGTRLAEVSIVYVPTKY